MALTLTRYPGEAILIGPDIRIWIQQVRGRQVRLAIEAPDHVEILREELTSGDDGVDRRRPVG